MRQQAKTMCSFHFIFSLLSTMLLLYCSNNEGVQASKILFFHLAATSSHRTSIWPLAEKLAEKGHNITYIFPIPPEKKIGSHPNVEELTPSKMVPVGDKVFDNFDINFRLNNSLSKLLNDIFSITFDLCKAFYDSPEIQEWMNRPQLHYDLIMIDSSMGECIYGVVHKFQAKHVIFIPALIPHHFDAFGVVPESSSIPATITFMGFPPKPNKMGLFARLHSTIEPLIWRLGYLDYLRKVERLIEERMNLTDLPHLTEFEKNTSLVLVNAHFVEDYAMSLPPMFVSYSGLWCSKEKLQQRKSLPNAIEKFIRGKDSEGFIYVSFGSSANASSMPEELTKKFLEAFSAFPKLKFLWRWAGNAPKGKPENLLLKSWFPQHDVLAHSKIRGFLTQCGRPSSQEALCHGVPLITMPILGDQDYNSDRLEFIGAAIRLDFTNLTVDGLKHAIEEITYNEKYKKRMVKLSAMFKDRPLDPLDSTLYWIEYVIRHDDTSLLKPLAMNQTWYQRRLLDVYLLLTGIILSIIALVGGSIFLALKYTQNNFATENSINIEKRKSD